LEPDVAQKLILKEIATSTPPVPTTNVKFGRFTLIDSGRACYTINVPNHPKADRNGDIQTYINSYDKNKELYASICYNMASHEECVNTLTLYAKRAAAKSKGSDEPECKKAVLKSLNDPDSAKFGKLTVEGARACLTVNARNSLGGYTGDQQAILQVEDNGFEWKVLDITQLSHESCVKVINPLR
jgi:hypothetical protein